MLPDIARRNRRRQPSDNSPPLTLAAMKLTPGQGKAISRFVGRAVSLPLFAVTVPTLGLHGIMRVITLVADRKTREASKTALIRSLGMVHENWTMLESGLMRQEAREAWRAARSAMKPA
ncbi:MAG: hypothetical protein AB7G06_03500 [Bdellovibrionales bacterium]